MDIQHQIDSVQVERYKSEVVLFIIVFLLSIIIWIFLTISIIGIIYALMIAIFFFIVHIGFIAYVKGSAVRISPEQFPDLYKRVQELSNRIGLYNPPDTYIMQAGGTLNAMATRLFNTKYLILYSDLLEACENDEAARDMIIGHELGHIRAGHLTMIWFLLPGLFFPFIGTAYSRAREFTCDRYGAALSKDKNGALKGLAILSAGAKYGPMIKIEEFVKQQQDLNTGLMTIGKWLSTHPPLSERISALEPALLKEKISMLKGRIRAILIIASIIIIPAAISIGVWKTMSIIKEIKNRVDQTTRDNTTSEYRMSMDVSTAKIKVQSDFIALSELVKEVKSKTGNYPEDEAGRLTSAWKIFRINKEEPIDPFDGKSYGYYLIEGGYVLWSSGPDGLEKTDDDIVYTYNE